jgi:hypothetical protein
VVTDDNPKRVEREENKTLKSFGAHNNLPKYESMLKKN